MSITEEVETRRRVMDFTIFVVKCSKRIRQPKIYVIVTDTYGCNPELFIGALPEPGKPTELIAVQIKRFTQDRPSSWFRPVRTFETAHYTLTDHPSLFGGYNSSIRGIGSIRLRQLRKRCFEASRVFGEPTIRIARKL